MKLNITAPLTNKTSYGIASLNTIKALAKQGHEVAAFPIGGFDEWYDNNEAELLGNAVGRSNFFDPYSPSLRIYHANSLAQHVGKGKRVGWTFFELDRFTPQEIHHLRSQDLVLVASQWAKQVCTANGVRASVVPLGVDTTVFFPTHESTGDTLRIFTVGKLEYRKGHAELADIFNAAFTKDDNVSLTISWDCMFRSEQELLEKEREYKETPLGDKINFIRKVKTSKEVAAFINSQDVGIFPTRAEGFCLPALETLACGKRLIITNVTGQTEFINDRNSSLVSPGSLVQAFDNKWFYGQGNWYDIGGEQIDQFVEYLRTMYQAKQEGKLGLNQEGVATANMFAWGRSAAKLVEVLG